MKPVNWHRELGPAVLAARTEHKPILVDFYSETCLGCQLMEAVTYPHGEIEALLEREVVAVKCDVHQPRAEFRDLLRMARPLFTPLLLWLDWSGTELRRSTGFLPPGELAGEVGLVLGFVDLLHGRYREAYASFRRVTEWSARTHAAPEALYWAGVAAYRLDGRGLDGLTPEWAELGARYRGSTWALRASCLARAAAPSVA